MTSLDELVAAGGLTPPSEPFDWDHAEAVLGARIPNDFQSLLNAGGGGIWFHYIRLFPPAERYGSRSLLEAPGAFEDLQILWEDEAGAPPTDLEEETRLLPWANTSGGETIFWRVDPGADPEKYPIYVEEQDGEFWERYDLSATDFLAGIRNGTVHSELFATSFMDVTDTFVRYQV